MSTTPEENINIWISQIQSEYKAAVSVDCVIFGYDEMGLKALLIKCNMPPYEGMLSLIGDLSRPDEELDQSVKRVLKQYTGLTDIFMEQVKAFSKVNRHPLGRVITIAYYSLVQIHDFEFVDLENKQVQWVSCSAIRQLAFDHGEILNECLKKLRRRIKQEPIGFNLLPKKFTINQLRNLYEVVLEIKLDKRNFRRKLNSLNLLIDLQEMQKSVAHRPAKLYSFDIEKYQTLKRAGLKFDL